MRARSVVLLVPAPLWFGNGFACAPGKAGVGLLEVEEEGRDARPPLAPVRAAERRLPVPTLCEPLH